MRYILLTQGKYAIVDDEDLERLSKYKWCAHKHQGSGITYAERATGDNIKKGRILGMHRLVLNITDNRLVDHANRDGLDNRKQNLRSCTKSQNCFNRKKGGYKNAPASSEYKGSTYHKGTGKWQSRIGFNNRSIHLGIFDSKEEAARAYDRAALKYFGEFARLNFKV